ncbi:50S ribosomal protein L24 [Candidatus Woesearchaeota archaeon]|nr:50S ribosomal protein L24 [Candidatus Woesearchaeota archaeon]
MKEWTKHWIKSKNPRKQRKYAINAPLHIARKLMSVRLNKDLKQKYGKRNFPIRTGDRIKVMTGQFKGKLVKISEVNLKNKSVYLEDVFIVKKDGNKIPVKIHPSNLMIMELNLDDKLRKKALERK